MNIGFVGYGNMTRALASRWVGRHRVTIGGRDAGKAAALAGELGASAAADAAGVVAAGDVVVLATPHDQVFSAIDAAGGPGAFVGKVVVDINNPVSGIRQGDFVVATFEGKSLAEAIAARLPGAHVVKAFNMCQAKVWTMGPPVMDGRTLVTLIAGDDAGAKGAVAELVRDIGSEPLDIGDLRYARALEAAAGLVIKLLLSGRDPRTVLNLIQPEVKPI